LVGDSGGMVDTAALKGVHHCIKSGILAAEAIYKALKNGSTDLTSYEHAVEESTIGKELYQVRNTRQGFQKGFVLGSLLAGPSIMSKGKLPPGKQEWHRDDAEEMFVGDTKKGYPKPDGKYTFDKLSSVFITGNETRDDAPNHIRIEKHVDRRVAEMWANMCPAGVYEVPEDAPADGPVDVIVNYTNCVQCGAITAKGGRLTTPEGGDGPLYQIT
ncbi:MAG TPA: 4Fe-4S dicluster domain-containing protein, partial [Solirubrobacteraceae bacterium]|nr:4Fe-4S dicluster domain-containing protein [Solirubrobacteraceae bacterium]